VSPILTAALGEGDRVLLDSSALIPYLNGAEPATPPAVELVENLVKGGRNPAVVSIVTAMELLVQPRRRSEWHYLHMVDFLTHHPNMRCQPIDLPVAQEAAGIRAMFGLATADSLVVATGIVAQVGYLVTNDERWKKRLKPIGNRIEVVFLNDFR
jgi:predicted nucleic acid-binding protein